MDWHLVTAIGIPASIGVAVVVWVFFAIRKINREEEAERITKTPLKKCHMCNQPIKKPHHTNNGVIHEWCEGYQ